MAKYTVELKRLIDTGFDIGLTDYPIFDESYRAVLNRRIINHFAYREIGFETPAMFRFYLNNTLDEIMPVYNKLYLAQAQINGLTAVDLTETLTAATASKTESASLNTAESKQTADDLNVSSLTPAGLLSVADIKTNTYASEANRTDNTTENETTATGQAENTSNSQTTYTKRKTGNDGIKNNSELFLDFMRAIKNIDRMIFTELNSCFMGVY